MAEKFVDTDLRCEACGEHGSHLSFYVSSRMQLCETCRENKKFAITNVPSADQKSRVCDNHIDRIVELFCHTCKREICMMCGMTSHSLHEKAELKQVGKNPQLAVEEQLKSIKIREEEWLTIQNSAANLVKSCDRIKEHFQSVQEDVNTSALKNMDEIDNSRQCKEDKIRRDTQIKIKEIETSMEKKLNCNNIEARIETQRVQDAKDSIINRLSILRDAATKKTSVVTDAVAERTSSISSILEGRGIAEPDSQAGSQSVAEDATRIAKDMMKALDQLGSLVYQVMWVPDHKGKLSDNNLVSTIWKPKFEHPLKCDPSPCSIVGGDTLVYIDVASGSVHAMDLNNGNSRPISQHAQGNSNYTDCFSMGQDIFACECKATELQYEAHLCQLELDKAAKAKTTIVLDHKVDERVAVYAAVNDKGVIMVAYDGSDSIIKVTGQSKTSENILQKLIGLKGNMIGLKSKKIGGKLHATSGGKFIIDTGPSEFMVINKYGTICATICSKEWGFGLCGTDPLDDILYVSYQPDGSDMVRVDEVALDGTIRRRGVVEYKVNGMFSEPIVTTTGLLTIRNGQNILVYERTPFTTALSTLDMKTSS